MKKTKKYKEVLRLQEIIEHHKNIISKGKAKNKEARKKMLDRIKQYEQRVLEIEKNEKESLDQEKLNEKYTLKLKPKKKNNFFNVSVLKKNIDRNKNNEFILKKKIKNSLTELKKLNQLIVKQQKLQKNNEAIFTQAEIDKLKKKLNKYSDEYSKIPKTKKSFIPNHWEKANLSSSLAIMRGSGLIYSPINAQAQRQTKGYKKRKKNKRKKK